MCGRVVVTSSPEELRRCLGVAEILEAFGGKDYNLAPTDRLPLVWAEARMGNSGQEVIRILGTARWGLIPRWTSSPEIGVRMFNARAETVEEKPAFRGAYERRRCLIPVNGFYEWGTGGEGQGKEPWYIYRSDGDLLALAGLWDYWSSSDSRDAELRTCTVITVPANADLRSVHHRMPALLEPEDWSGWLDPGEMRPETLSPMLRPAPDGLLGRYQVDRRVNNSRNNGPELLEVVRGDSDSRSSRQGRLW